VPVLLSQGKTAGKLAFKGRRIDLYREAPFKGSTCNPAYPGRSRDLAYVIYTSGSTGRPKGVGVEHLQLVNLIFHMYNNYDGNVGSNDCCLSLTNIMFDVSVWEFFLPLIFGARLVLLQAHKRFDVFALAETILREAVTLIYLPPGLLKEVNELLQKERGKVSLNKMLAGVEPIRDEVLEDYMRLNPHMRIINGYGPTEAAVCATSLNYRSHRPEGKIVPIGVPLANNQVFLLDAAGHPVPQGIPGEICVSGAGLSRGYINNPELTAGKFTTHELTRIKKNRTCAHTGEGKNLRCLASASPQSSRLYKTGDLARWRDDGNIEFLGRIDQQVKIRGYRIELGEIGNCLSEHPATAGAVVTAGPDATGELSICAYVVPLSQGDPEIISQLRNYLQKKLPAYMTPANFVIMDHLPLTPNGKIDRKSLPHPKAVSSKPYAAPGNEIETRLVEIWSEALKIEPGRIGINDNFFELGGHSLKILSLIGKIHKKLNIKIPFDGIFAAPTVQAMARYIKKMEKSRYETVPSVEKKERYNLSSVQERLYFLYRMAPRDTVYNMTGLMRLEGRVERGKLEAVFQKIVTRHESFRTSFHMQNESPVQRIHEAGHINFRITLFKLADNKKLPAQKIIENFIRPFDLSQPPLLRVGLIEEKEREYILAVDMHHIISDGVSIDILTNEFTALYEGRTLPVLGIRYKDVSAWWAGKNQKNKLKQQEAFWLKEFAAEIPVLDLPIDYPRPALRSFTGSEIFFTIDAARTRELNLLALREGATLFMVLFATFNLLLAKICNQADIIIGTPVAGRLHPDLENIIGMFVNTLPLRNFPDGEKTFKTFLAEVGTRTLQALSHQEYSYADLIEKTVKERDVSRNPLFDALFVQQAAITSAGGLELRGSEGNSFKIKPYSKKNNTTKFDLGLAAVETEETLQFKFEYCDKLFKEETILRFINYFKNLIFALPRQFTAKLSEIEIISESEKRQILFDFNDTAAEFPLAKTMHRLFEEQAQRSPHHTALVGRMSNAPGDGHVSLTYGELNKKAGRSAHMLREKGIAPGAIVALMAERSVEAIICIFGILKAGAAYLPIEPAYPEGRKKYMLADSGAAILVTTSFAAAEITEKPGAKRTLSHRRLSPAASLAYVLYTSGSTGKPKGVLVEHRHAVNTITWFSTACRLKNGVHVLQMSDYTFDPSVNQIFGTLLHGAALFLIDKKLLLNREALRRYIDRHAVEILYFVPQMLNELLGSGPVLKSVRVVLCGGERLHDAVKDNLLAKKYNLYNLYGPTETAIDALAGRCAAGPVTLGTPIPNVQCYVFDRYRKLLPPGIPGELYIGGSGVARGYLNNVELTAERFTTAQALGLKLQDKKEAVAHSPQRLYKTGDRGRRLPEGNIEFLGRIDYQVKFRGFRIELGEIEVKLLSFAGIKKAIVLLKEKKNGDKYLCAYLVSDNEINTPALRQFLLKDLPAYMAPSYFMQIEKMPLTFNGKINRKALPEPEPRTIPRNYEAPRDNIEKKLADIWAATLGIDKKTISVHDNFFNLGGHSLKATQLAGKIHKELKVNVPLPEVFNIPDMKGLAAYIKKEAPAYNFTPVEPVEKKEYYPPSSAQKRFYVLQQMDPANTGFNFSVIAALKGNIDKKRLKNAFRELVKRHECLRTTFREVAGTLVQQVHAAATFEFSSNDRFTRPFDLSRAPLLRAAIIEESQTGLTLMVDFHHISVDGLCLEILSADLSALYEGKALAPLPAQYKDYSQWQAGAEQKNKLDDQLSYWLKTFDFDGDAPVLSLPIDYKRPAVQCFEGDFLQFRVAPQENAFLKELARKEKTTLYIVLLSICNIWLAKICNQDIIITGTGAACRRHPDIQHMAGSFQNMLALVNYPRGEKTFTRFLKEAIHRTMGAFENQEYPFEELVKKVGSNREQGRNPLFDVFFLSQDADARRQLPGAPAKKSGRLKLEARMHRNKRTRFDLGLYGHYAEHEIIFTLEYGTRLFKPGTIQRLAAYFLHLTEGIAANPDAAISELDILREKEKKEILFGFNDTKADYSRDKTMHRLFEEQAQKNPGNIAVISDGESVTYGRLNEKANRLARELRKQGLKPNRFAAVIMDRSVEMVVGVMAILKAGGAYAPIEPYLPGSRIITCLTLLEAEYLLTCKNQLNKITALCDRLPALTNIFCLDTSGPHKKTPGSRRQRFLPAEKIAGNSGQDIEPAAAPEDIAYVIFTSGTTGTPKGVVVRHRPVINVLQWVNRRFEVRKPDKLLFVVSLGFDLSVYDIFGTLASGAALRIAGRNELKSPERLLDIIFDEGITFWDSAPAALQLLAPYLQQLAGTRRDKSRLRLVFLSGDWIPLPMPGILAAAFKGVKVIALGGATEAAIWSNYFPVERVEPHWVSIPYGKPIPNAAYYILDEFLNPCPPGTAGDLYIGGECLASGYLGDEVLTAAKFIPNPFTPGEKMYKTGDLARWFSQNNPDMEFLGRKDSQVKIRGYRIELGEIESRLLAQKNIEEVVVTARGEAGGDRYLCAYYVADRVLSAHRLSRFLAETLPDYMIPPYFVKLEKMPVTPNGKIDRKALPEPVFTGETGEYTPPGDEIEKKLARIWSQILKIDKEKISINADFFQLGGHSLSATTLVAAIHKELSVKLPLTRVFQLPTIKGLAQCIKKTEIHGFTAVEPVEKKEYYPMSSAQRRLYILQQVEEKPVAYNIFEALEIKGKPDLDKLAAISGKLIRRHESLRTSFFMINDEAVQRVHEETLTCFRPPAAGESETKDIESIIANFIEPFDLAKAPLLRFSVILLQAEKSILIMDLHHIIADGASAALLINEFTQGYAGKELPALKIQYKDYSLWHNRREVKKNIKLQETYWLNRFAGEVPVLALPADYSRPLIQGFAGHTLQFEMDREESETLKSLALQQGATLFMLLLSLYTIFLSKLSGQEDIVVGTPIAGRRHADLQPITGMFVNTLALRNFPVGAKSFGRFLKEIKESTIKAFDNQDYLYEDLVDRVGVERDTGRNPLFDAMFVLQNMEAPVIEISGLKMQHVDYETRKSKFDLTLFVLEREENLVFIFEYSTDLFKQETIRRFIGFFKKTIAGGYKNQNGRIADIEIITEAEKNRILHEFNGRETEYPEDKTVHRLFAEQVERTPWHTALVGQTPNAFADNAALTYEELNRKAHRLADMLIKKGAGPDTIVGIMAERSIDAIIGILGILKAGGAYLPIDSGYPEERKKYMLADSGASILLTAENTEQLPAAAERTGHRGSLHAAINISISRLCRAPAQAISLAYVMYTSGSTGKPKGVMLQHRSLVNLIRFQNERTTLGAGRVSQFISISFDVSFQEIFSTFLSGGTLFLIPRETGVDVPEFFYFVTKHNIKTLYLPMSLLRAIFNEEQWAAAFPACVTHIQTAGEQVAVNHRFGNYLQQNQVVLHNHYGPTESHVVTSFSIDPKGEIPGAPPIGKPVDNSAIYILEFGGARLAPIGIAGELYIGGLCLARGYLNRPELTNERFIDENRIQDRRLRKDSANLPKSAASETKLYRTGDLARWLPDGNIEFLGRIDHQVKIRGFRIELGEIEKQLLTYGRIKEAIVIAGEDNNDKYLCAYIVAKSEETGPVDQTRLREYLANRLPEYMAPSYIVQLDKLPLTPNKKIDRKALPAPGITTGSHPGDFYQAPQDEIEKKLTEIWADVLGVEPGKIGSNDNFFHLGGHSLKAMIVMNRIGEVFATALTIRNLFQLPTIAGLAPLIRKSAITHAAVIEKLPEQPYYELSHAQKRLWFLNKMEPRHNAYNLPAKITLYEAVDRSVIQKILERWIIRHEGFRTFFKEMDEGPVQLIKPTAHIKPVLDVTEWSHLSECERENRRSRLLGEEARHVFDLTQWPLFRIRLIKYAAEEYDIVLNLHHIIADGWSLEILMQEFNRLYEAYKKGISRAAEPLRIQYKDYAAWHNRLLEDEEKMGKAKEFWRTYLSGALPRLDLPYDFFPGPGGPVSRKSSAYSFVIDKKITAGLRSFAGEHQGSLFMVLLTGFNLLLSHITGQEEILMAVPAAARQHGELKNIIGMFVNTLILRGRVDMTETFIDLFRAVQGNTFDALEYQGFPMESIFSELKMKYPEISVFFNMVNIGINQGQRLTLRNLKNYHIEDAQEAKFDIVCYLTEYENAVQISCHYFRELFRPETIERIMGLYTRILNNIAEDPGKKAKDYCISPKKKNILAGIKGFKNKSPGKEEKSGATLLNINEEVKDAQKKLSKVNSDFLDYAGKNPGCFKLSNFKSLDLNDDLFKLQPWPTFIDTETKAAFRQVGVKLFDLIKQIPAKVFNYDLQKMSAFYETPRDVPELQLEGATAGHIDNLVGRGDFILSPTGIKCLEYNVSSNLGGLEIPVWESLCLKAPILKQFLKEYQVKIKNENLLTLFLEHALRCCLKKFGPRESPLNIALVMNGYNGGKRESARIGITLDYLNRLYKKILQQMDTPVEGEVVMCDYQHFNIKDNRIFLKNKKIHAVQEGYNGMVSPIVMNAFKGGNLCLFNGPITKLLSNKLNLALLSDPTFNTVFTKEEKHLIDLHVPWTRKISRAPTTYKGETIENPERFMLSNRERLVIKPALGYGGESVQVGNKTPPQQWEQWVKTALHKKDWVVQELVEAPGGVYQLRDSWGYYDMVWGFFIFGSQYTGACLRVMPREQSKGVINCHEGASASVVFEVDT
jgi:tyrocidine synthetase-3